VKINRRICRQHCESFKEATPDYLKPLGDDLRRTGWMPKDMPKFPTKHGLCAKTHWIVNDGVYDDEDEVPPGCPFKTEMAVTQ
jgi:hypothetical protein